MAITTKQQRVQRRNEALKLIADDVPPTDLTTLIVFWAPRWSSASEILSANYLPIKFWLDAITFDEIKTLNRD